MPGAIFEPFEVVVVPFPFTEKDGGKRRPGLVVSTRTFNGRHDHLVLAMITTAGHGAWPSDVRLKSWSAAGLTKPCVVRCKLFTLDVSLILRRVGMLAASDSVAVQKTLAQRLAVA